MALVTNRDQPTALRIARTLFQSGSISTSAAARIAGLPLPHFLELLSSLRIPISSSDPADTCSDLEALKKL
jgi:predicted HTH domain antitoxin